MASDPSTDGMRHVALVALTFLCVLVVSCSRGSPLGLVGESALLVHVHWEDLGLGEKRVEILELGEVRLTDESGFASFVLRSGSYTLRAYELNGGGPSATFLDIPVKTIRGEVTRVEVVDCLPCVRPNQGP